ncbi:hypothetical protein DFA_03186 [Cavenderia fasciculata]|uniref:IPT/TIG domain-containing protein n=1 Tax=Cavenderia fasciculata TaxID=261658 RepID=F4PGV7_CACFS|nr:uncharacterized protein DFA_03186 [Cavenderia fasciculata]EGG24941.1 hypothetical protein DFA_03186 [Cavenderia fasciculata]|eukprot:XP_004362792.1 hypothetical protein DFA_03186 [Cavenderia fasciculata]
MRLPVKEEKEKSVPKKSSPPKKMNNRKSLLSNGTTAAKAPTPQVHYFKDIERLNSSTNLLSHNQKSEVKSLASYYEQLNNNKNQKAKSTTIAAKPVVATTTTSTTTTAPVVVATPVVVAPAVVATPVVAVSPKRRRSSAAKVSSATTTPSLSSTETTPSPLSPKVSTTLSSSSSSSSSTNTTPKKDSSSAVPDMTTAIRETIDVYRNKITDLEKQLEHQHNENKSLKQELLLMNDVNVQEIDQLTIERDELQLELENVQAEIDEATEDLYNARGERDVQMSLVNQYKKELLDCQTLVGYYQEEFGKKCAENNELTRKLTTRSDEIKQYKQKIQSFLQLVDQHDSIKQNITVDTSSSSSSSSSVVALNTSYSSLSNSSLIIPSSPSKSSTPNKKDTTSMINNNNSSSSINIVGGPLSNSTNQQRPSTSSGISTPKSAAKKKVPTTSNSNSSFKSPTSSVNQLSKSHNRTPKKILSSPRSILHCTYPPFYLNPKEETTTTKTSINFTIHCENYPTGAQVWSTSKGGNGHGYMGISTNKEAMTKCLAFESNTIKSYIATIDSKQELDFIKTNWPATPVWVSGRDIGGIGNYSYSSGPGTNQPLFNMYTGQCFGYCPFDAGEPSLTPADGKEKYIYIRGPTWNFKNAVLMMSQALYVNWLQFQKNSVTCIVPLGFHDVTVQDASGTSSTHYAWQPYPPFIKAVYPPSSPTNALVTLIGNNFGDTNGLVSVSVSTLNIPCIISFASSNQIICQLETPLVGETKLLPISISVDQVYTQTYKPHICIFNSILMQYSFSIVCGDRFFSTILCGGDYERVYRLMIDKVTMGATFNTPYVGAFESQEIGPYKGTPSPLYYDNKTSVTPSDHILYNIHNGKVVPFDTKNVKYYTPLITFYTSDTPIINNVTNIIPGQTSQVTINGNHFGKDGSYVLITIQSKQCKSPSFVGDGFKQITCLLDTVQPYSTDLNYTVQIGISGMVTTKVVSLAKECRKNFSSHGIGNSTFGTCKCHSGYEPPLDCSSSIDRDKQLNTTVMIQLNNHAIKSHNPDDPLSQQTDKQGFNLLTTFHIPRFSHSVELDPVFNAVILDDDSALPYECIETTDSLPKVIVSVLLSIFLLSITIVAIIVWKVEPPTNRPYREAVEMDPIPNTDQENADQQQQQNN